MEYSPIVYLDLFDPAHWLNFAYLFPCLELTASLVANISLGEQHSQREFVSMRNKYLQPICSYLMCNLGT